MIEGPRPQSQETSSDRSFGFTFAGVFFLVAVVPMLRGNSFRTWAFAVGLGFLLVALLFPIWLKWPNRMWTALGRALHCITNPVVMAVLFFCAVTPAAVLLRVFGVNFLRTKFDKDSQSYWIPKQRGAPSARQGLRYQF